MKVKLEFLHVFRISSKIPPTLHINLFYFKESCIKTEICLPSAYYFLFTLIKKVSRL